MILFSYFEALILPFAHVPAAMWPGQWHQPRVTVLGPEQWVWGERTGTGRISLAAARLRAWFCWATSVLVSYFSCDQTFPLVIFLYLLINVGQQGRRRQRAASSGRCYRLSDTNGKRTGHLHSLVCQSSAFVAFWLFISFAAEWPVLPALCSDRGRIWISTIKPCSAACRQMISHSRRWKDCFNNLWFDLMIEIVSISASCWPIPVLFGKTLNLEYQMTSGHFFLQRKKSVK